MSARDAGESERELPETRLLIGGRWTDAASGAVFDQQGWTVASRELPLGTVLLVTRGSRSVLVLVNDRGPFVPGRVLDLSRAVATELGTVEAGVAHVRGEVVRLP